MTDNKDKSGKPIPPADFAERFPDKRKEQPVKRERTDPFQRLNSLNNPSLEMAFKFGRLTEMARLVVDAYDFDVIEQHLPVDSLHDRMKLLRDLLAEQAPTVVVIPPKEAQ